MKYYRYKVERGFIALTSLILIVSGILVFSATTLGAAVQYSEQVYKRELRIQARYNAESCADWIRVMIDKDYFLIGEVYVPQFDCIGFIEKNPNGTRRFDVISRFESVSMELQDQEY